jgi:peptide-methionine (S)-S-oxide reductase
LSKEDGMADATFAAGCFWGVEEKFRCVPGVLDAEVGYAGGSTPEPTYRKVCSGRTGHAESVHVTYDSERVTYEQLLDAFWHMHDPTTQDRQGPDIGSQYRSVIFYHSEEQKEAALASRASLGQSGSFGGRPIVTEIVSAGPFYRAEEYHQRYFEKAGRSACAR